MAENIRTEERTAGGVRRSMCSRKSRAISLRILVGNQAKTEFRYGLRWDDALGARSIMPARHAIQSQRGPNGCPFIKAETRFSPSPFNLCVLKNLLVGGSGALHESALFFTPMPHIIVKARDGYAPVSIVQAAQ